VSTFSGSKSLYLSEVNALGGTNTFLGLVFLGFAGLVVLIMIVFIILYFAKIAGRDIYSTEDMKW